MATENGKKPWWQKALYNADSDSTTESQQVSPSPAKPAKRPVTKIMQSPTPAPVFPQETSVDNGEVDETYINHLYDFMTKNNLPGPDYYEFANSLDEMTSELAGASEEKIFQMTYKVAYKQNLPVDKLLETAKTYIDLFGKHKKEFEDFLNTESQKTIGAKNTEIANLQKANSDATNQIATLKKQIISLEAQVETNNQKMDEDNSFVESETQKLTIKKSKFQKAFSVIIDKINGDIDKIKQYLK
jgi:hypothetical protein